MDEQFRTLIERIRDYVRSDLGHYTPDVRREIAAVEAWIESGHQEIEAYLKRHAEFAEWLAERGEEVA
jgi:hypothetical protein